MNANPNAILDAEMAEIAFQRSSSYTFQGEPVTWSQAHNWMWLKISRYGDMTEEEDALAAMWLGGIDEIETLKNIEAAWRNDRDNVFSELRDYLENFHHDADDTLQARELLHGQIIPDLKASHNILDNDEKEGGDEFTGAPGKSDGSPATSSTSEQPPDSPRMKSVTASRLPKENSSTPSSCDKGEINSSPQSCPEDSDSKTSPD